MKSRQRQSNWTENSQTVLTYIKDKKLVRDLLSGDEGDFKRFFDAYFPRLYRFADDRLKDHPDAVRDVVQSTLSKTLLNLDKYRGESALFTWMCSICKNEIYDYLKNQSKYEKNIVLESDLPDPGSGGLSGDVDSTEQPSEIYQRVQSARQIHRVLDQLPFEYGNLIEWKYIEGLSVKQMAERMGLSPSATQSMLYRARMAFQQCHEELS